MRENCASGSAREPAGNRWLYSAAMKKKTPHHEAGRFPSFPPTAISPIPFTRHRASVAAEGFGSDAGPRVSTVAARFLPPIPPVKHTIPARAIPSSLHAMRSSTRRWKRRNCWQRQSASSNAPCLARTWSWRTSRAIWSWRRGRFAAATTTSALAIRTSARSRGTPRWRR